jgi:mRNA-degrading endonuclease toxin of MazEF toxin-antitoxin module
MITRTTHRAQYEPTQYLLDPAKPDGSVAGVLHPSVIACENLLTVEQQLVFRKIGTLPAEAMRQVNDCLRG